MEMESRWGAEPTFVPILLTVPGSTRDQFVLPLNLLNIELSIFLDWTGFQCPGAEKKALVFTFIGIY